MKKGFTLVELMAVIVILSVIMLIATISISKIRKDSAEELLETTIQSIEKSAIVYGQENPDFSDKICECDDGKEYTESCFIVTVEKLISGNYYVSSEPELTNNVTGVSMMDDTFVVYRKNNRIYSSRCKISSNG